MNNMTYRTKKNILSLEILILMGFCGYFYWAISYFEYNLVQEHLASAKIKIDSICHTVDYFVESEEEQWELHDYKHILSRMVSEIDVTPGLYAELFDEELTTISERTASFPHEIGSPEKDDEFKLLSYPDVLERIIAENSGETVVCFNSRQVGPHNVYLLWQWVPTNSSHDDRLLIIVGVSKYSVSTSMSAWIICGAVVLVIISAIRTVVTAATLFSFGIHK